MRESWLAEPWLSLIVAGGLVALTAVLVLALTRSAGLGPTPRWPTLAGPRPDEFPVWDPDEVAAAALALPALPPVVEGRIERVVDGDTFRVRVGDTLYTVRALGIDTPETKDPRKPPQCYGAEATAYALEVLGGRRVGLEADRSQDARDRYGRELRYIRLTDSGVLYQALALIEGTAREYTYTRPQRYQAEFRRLEAEARSARRGLWGACQPLPWPAP